MSTAETTASSLVGRKIRGILAEAGMTQTQLAAAVGVTQSLVSKRLRGDVRWTIDDIVDAACALDVPLERIVPADELIRAAS